jgi:hypothetical protein
MEVWGIIGSNVNRLKEYVGMRYFRVQEANFWCMSLNMSEIEGDYVLSRRSCRINSSKLALASVISSSS